MVKRSKRQKAWVGAAIGALGSLASGLFSIYNTNKQIEQEQQAIDAQNAAMRRNANSENASILASNLSQLIANQQDEDKNRIITTQTSALKLGGRRCKKCGGGKLTKFI